MERKWFKLAFVFLEIISFLFAGNGLIMSTEMLMDRYARESSKFHVMMIICAYTWCTLVLIKAIFGIVYIGLPFVLKYHLGYFVPGYVNMVFDFDQSFEFHPVFSRGGQEYFRNYHLIKPYGDLMLFHCYRYLFFSISVGYPLICCLFISINTASSVPCAFIIFAILPYYGWLLNTRLAVCGTIRAISPYVILLNFYFSFISENPFACLATIPALLSVHVFPIHVRKRMYGLRSIEWLVLTVTTANICYSFGFIVVFFHPYPVAHLLPWEYIPDYARFFFYPQFNY